MDRPDSRYHEARARKELCVVTTTSLWHGQTDVEGENKTCMAGEGTRGLGGEDGVIRVQIDARKMAARDISFLRDQPLHAPPGE